MRPTLLRPTARLRYGTLALVVLAAEAAIALFVRDRFVRPLVGDLLAVVLVHCLLRAALPLAAKTAALAALGIAVAVELGQAAGLPGLLGLDAHPVARVVLGSTFDPRDLIAYALGAAAAAGLERLHRDARPLRPHDRAGIVRDPPTRRG